VKALPYRGAEDLSPEQQLAIRRQAAREMARRGLIGVLVYPAFTLILAMVTPFGTDYPFLAYGVLAATTLASLLRAYLFLYFDRLYDQRAGSWRIAYTLSICVTGIATGLLGGVAVNHYGISWAALLTTLMIAGICAGALTSMSMSHNTLRLYLIFMLLPSIAGSLTLDGNMRFSMSFAFLTFLAYTLLQARNMSREYWEALINSVRLDAETKKRLHTLTYTDPLTGLPNRELFRDRLRQALAEARRTSQLVSVMSLGLDRFKKINDTLGHQAGDDLLREIARRLQGTIREGDTVSRLGGDTFAIICPMSQDTRNAARVAQKMMEALSRPTELAGLELVISASIGITVFPRDGENLDALLKNAEAAMFRVKDKGGNAYQYYKAEMNAQAMERLKIEARLRRALERNEFCLHYQPKIRLGDGRLAGFEALIRWCPPGEPMVPPGQFISVLEDTGLIVPVGEWVLREACRQNKAWQEAGLRPVTMAVNLSARQFRETDLAEQVEQILGEAGLDPQWLELEITESMLMDQMEQTQVTLNRLDRLGVSMAIDDFGTGYSSLSYLKSLPIDTLKIDRSFVKDIPADSNDVAVVQAVIAMAHNLKLRVVAEGAETAEQVTFLRAQGCDEMQGFYFSRPMKAEEFPPMIELGVSMRLLALIDEGGKPGLQPA
jgi:diguanylate cyclase (GGDEF)-like protein